MSRPPYASAPRRKTFLVLPEAARKRVLSAAFRRITLFPLPANLFILYGQWVNYGIATGRPVDLPWWTVAIFLASALALLVEYLASLHRLVGREAAAAGVPLEE